MKRPLEATPKNRETFLILKADAYALPLGDNSVDLVLATPPYIGATRFQPWDFCTNNRNAYRKMRNDFLAEVIRVLKPKGCVLITPCQPPVAQHAGSRRVVFHAFRKKLSHGDWLLQKRRSEIFFTHYVAVPWTCWWAFPVRIYRDLLVRYSTPKDIIVHIFSGSGNCGLAALEKGRPLILVDLNYHRHVKRRLHRWIVDR